MKFTQFLIAVLVLAFTTSYAVAGRPVKNTYIFGKLPKGPVPPSGPSGRIGDTPPSQWRSHFSSAADVGQMKLIFGELPKGVPIPPSGPSRRTSDPPPPPPPRWSHFSSAAEVGQMKLIFGELPKGVPIPPSGPSRRTSDPPPPPRTRGY